MKPKTEILLFESESPRLLCYPDLPETFQRDFCVKRQQQNALGLCYLPDGKNYYAYLVKDTTGCYDSVETIFKRIQSQLVKDIHTLRQIAQKNPQLFSDSGG